MLWGCSNKTFQEPELRPGRPGGQVWKVRASRMAHFHQICCQNKDWERGPGQMLGDFSWRLKTPPIWLLLLQEGTLQTTMAASHPLGLPAGEPLQKCPNLEKSLSEHGEDREPGLAFPIACFRKPWELEIEPTESLLGHGFLNFHFLWLILLNYLGGNWLDLLQLLKITIGSPSNSGWTKALG